MTARPEPRPYTNWHGVAVDKHTGRTIRQIESGAWISNEEWLALQDAHDKR